MLFFMFVVSTCLYLVMPVIFNKLIHISLHLMQGDRTDKRDTSAFNTWKDIIIPGNIDDGMTTHGSRLVEPLPLSKRKHLANYLGRAQGKVGRLQLIELAKQFPEKVCFLLVSIDFAHVAS